VTELSQDDEGVTVVTDTSEGPVTLRGSYLVGCDGGRSIVRKNSGIYFVGTGPTTISRMGFATATAAHTIRFGFHRMERGWLMRFPGNRWIVIEWDVPEDLSTPMTVDELNEAILRVSGQDLGLSNPVFVTRSTDNARQADRYCVGRVMLAGDAAHVHSPAGGQGLNLGLQDAFNLGWKLAATLHGWAPPHLLDTYHAERHPIAAEVLANTRAQLALMRPGPHVDALREIFARILEMEEPNRYITEMVTGNDVRYARPRGRSPAGRWLRPGHGPRDRRRPRPSRRAAPVRAAGPARPRRFARDTYRGPAVERPHRAGHRRGRRGQWPP
jgi:2-polyprenyl-6-methoxyphenol hydroxylase-like FAD-dependent oxidoreductase